MIHDSSFGVLIETCSEPLEDSTVSQFSKSRGSPSVHIDRVVIVGQTQVSIKSQVCFFIYKKTGQGSSRLIFTSVVYYQCVLVRKSKKGSISRKKVSFVDESSVTIDGRRQTEETPWSIFHLRALTRSIFHPYFMIYNGF